MTYLGERGVKRKEQREEVSLGQDQELFSDTHALERDEFLWVFLLLNIKTG